MALALFLVQYRAISRVIHPHLLPCFHDASSEVFFASIPQTEMVACPPRFSCRVATVHDGKQQADGGNLGKTEDGMDGWMGREDLPIASAMAHEGGVSLRNPGAEAGPEVSFPHRYLEHPSRRATGPVEHEPFDAC